MLRAGSSSSDLSSLYRNDMDPTTNEYDVIADITTGEKSADAYYTLAGRMDPTGINNLVDRYVTTYRHASGSELFDLRKVVSGVETVLDTLSEDLGSGTNAFKLEIRDAAKKVFIGAVEKLTTADDVITQDGRAGIGAPKPTAFSGQFNYMDNFSAETAVAGGNTVTGVLPLAGAGAMAMPSPVIITLGQLPLVGAGAVVFAGAPLILGQLPLAGAGSLATTGLILTLGSIDLTGAGSMVPSGTNILLGVLPLAGLGSMAPDGHNIAFAVLPLSGAGNITMVAEVINIGGPPVKEGALNLTGIGVMAVAPLLINHAVLPLAGAGVFSASGENIIVGGLPLSGTGSMSPTGESIIVGLMELTGSGAMLPAGHAIIFGVIPLAGAGSLSLEGEVAGDWQDFGEIKRLIVASASDIYKFSVVAKSIDGVKKTEVRFYNIDDDQVVAGTTMFTISLTSVILTSGVLALTGSKEYKAQMKGSGV